MVGNDIFMPREHAGEAIFEAAGTMTRAGLELLGHRDIADFPDGYLISFLGRMTS